MERLSLLRSLHRARRVKRLPPWSRPVIADAGSSGPGRPRRLLFELSFGTQARQLYSFSRSPRPEPEPICSAHPVILQSQLRYMAPEFGPKRQTSLRSIRAFYKPFSSLSELIVEVGLISFDKYRLKKFHQIVVKRGELYLRVHQSGVLS